MAADRSSSSNSMYPRTSVLRSENRGESATGAATRHPAARRVGMLSLDQLSVLVGESMALAAILSMCVVSAVLVGRERSGVLPCGNMDMPLYMGMLWHMAEIGVAELPHEVA